MTKRLDYRGTSFNVPSNRKLWQSLGEYDSLVQFQEVASLILLESYDSTKESFRDYLIRISKSTGIHLNDISLENYKQVQHQSYLIFPNASFDDFLSDFIDDIRLLIDDKFSINSDDGCKFDKIMESLKEHGIRPSIDKSKIKLYHYYRLLRNDVAHKLDRSFNAEYKNIDLNKIHGFYPSQGMPQPKNVLSFDDYILCTANVKNIADELTRSLLPHIDWEKMIVEKKEQIIPKYRKFIAENRTKRLKGYIKNCIFNMYSVVLLDENVDRIMGML